MRFICFRDIFFSASVDVEIYSQRCDHVATIVRSIVLTVAQVNDRSRSESVRWTKQQAKEQKKMANNKTKMKSIAHSAFRSTFCFFRGSDRLIEDGIRRYRCSISAHRSSLGRFWLFFFFFSYLLCFVPVLFSVCFIHFRFSFFSAFFLIGWRRIHRIRNWTNWMFSWKMNKNVCSSLVSAILVCLENICRFKIIGKFINLFTHFSSSAFLSWSLRFDFLCQLTVKMIDAPQSH